MIPENFTAPQGDPHLWLVFTQWHIPTNVTTPTLYGVPIGLNLEGRDQKLNIRVAGGVYDNQSCFEIAEGKCGYIWVDSLHNGKGYVPGHWYTFDLLIKFSTKQDGFVKGAIDGKPILHPYRGPILDPNDAPSQKLYFKQGIYRNANINGIQTVYHDDTFLVGTHTRP
jgi:hypothetical protein